jgi:hypothetical protein
MSSRCSDVFEVVGSCVVLCVRLWSSEFVAYARIFEDLKIYMEEERSYSFMVLFLYVSVSAVD